VSEASLVGLILIPVVVLGFLIVEAAYLYAQWEIAFTDRDLIVRRWTDALLGRPGRRVSLTGRVRAHVRTAGGIARQLLVERDSSTVADVSLILWTKPNVQQLTTELSNRGVDVTGPAHGGAVDSP
jgi:hypothetical protein